MNTRHAPPAPRLDEVAAGQRMLILAIGAYLAAAVGVGATGGSPIAIPFAVAAAGIAIAGLVRTASGLGYSSVTQAALAVLAVVPLVGLVTVAMVNERATKTLRAGGYRVGFFGAGRRPQ